MCIREIKTSIGSSCFGLRLWLPLMAAGLLLFPSRLLAHPMGNFSVNHYGEITIGDWTIELRYLIDMAEIPTFQEMQQGGITPKPGDPTVLAFLAAKAATLMKGLKVTVNGHPVTLRVVSQDVIFPPGAGNLPTMKLGLLYRGAIADSCNPERCELVYRDLNFPARAGWKEIIVRAAPGVVLLSSSVPASDRSALLTNYPTDLLNNPPQDLEARITFSRATAPARSMATGRLNDRKGANQIAKANQKVPSQSASHDRPPGGNTLPSDGRTSPADLRLEANRQATPRNAFTELIQVRQLSFGFILLSAAIAAGLGALHALEPGHGKTIVAAYLVGSKGTAGHAVALGMIVTIAHTAGVYLLGATTLYAQKYILPEKLYPFLGVLSGILIAGMGFYLFLQRYIGGEFVQLHSHGPQGHHHGGLWRSRANSGEHEDDISRGTETSPQSGRKVSARQLLILGITGGIVPCPAALVVLLSAVALHRIGFGFFLILAFSLGLAVVLIALGLLAVYAGSMMSRFPTESPLIQRWLPLTSSAMIAVLGCLIVVRGLIVAGVLPSQP